MEERSHIFSNNLQGALHAKYDLALLGYAQAPPENLRLIA